MTHNSSLSTFFSFLFRIPHLIQVLFTYQTNPSTSNTCTSLISFQILSYITRPFHTTRTLNGRHSLTLVLYRGPLPTQSLLPELSVGANFRSSNYEDSLSEERERLGQLSLEKDSQDLYNRNVFQEPNVTFTIFRNIVVTNGTWSRMRHGLSHSSPDAYNRTHQEGSWMYSYSYPMMIIIRVKRLLSDSESLNSQRVPVF